MHNIPLYASMRWIDVVCMSPLSSTRQLWTVRMMLQPIPSAHFTVVASMASIKWFLMPHQAVWPGVVSFNMDVAFNRPNFGTSTVHVQPLRGFILPSPVSLFCTFAFLVCWHEVHSSGSGNRKNRTTLGLYAFPR